MYSLDRGARPLTKYMSHLTLSKLYQPVDFASRIPSIDPLRHKSRANIYVCIPGYRYAISAVRTSSTCFLHMLSMFGMTFCDLAAWHGMAHGMPA